MPLAWRKSPLCSRPVLAAAVPLGAYIARVLAGERTFLSRVLAPVERVFYKLSGVDPAREQSWFVYTIAMLAFSVVGFVSLYALATAAECAAAQSAGLRSGRRPISPSTRR